mmetsp:Transcript_4159/g.8374  ORF Transcript_4159/g.8374 Transcript_4159/m.8374 type:complete len:81 (+) Transcript_4159:223-465(+)
MQEEIFSEVVQESLQSKAEGLADIIMKKVLQGYFSNLPLAELQDIPISLVHYPLKIAKCMLEHNFKYICVGLPIPIDKRR